MFAQDSIAVGVEDQLDGYGGAYMFRSSSNWSQPATRLVPDDFQYGRGLDLDGEVVAIGASGDFENDGNGAVYLYDDAEGARQIVGRLQLSAGNLSSSFGEAVAIDGDFALVGDPESSFAEQEGGAVHAFERDAAGRWTLRETIAPQGLQSFDDFGRAIDMRGDMAVIGAPLRGNGHVFVYERSGAGNWQLVEEIEVAAATDSRFGRAVAMEDDYFVVGAPANSGDNGALYILEPQGGTWTQTRIINPSGNVGDAFGTSVDCLGARVIAGAPGWRSGSTTYGHVDEWSKQGGGWVHTGGFRGLTMNGTSFARSVAMTEDAWYAGSPSELGFSGFVFEITLGGAQFEILQPGVIGTQDWFGLRIAADGNHLLATSFSDLVLPGEDGASFLFSTDGAGCGGTSVSYCTSSPSSLGVMAEILALGSLSVETNDLVLRAGPVPLGSPGVFLYGQQQAETPLPGGTLCIGLPAVRIKTFAPQQQFLTLALDLDDPPAGGEVLPGSTWNFQCWFRDAASASGSSLSDAIAVTFLP
ncbi:MAG: hypothetical protein GY711_05580 [bacterium]|nr:hypothetical protein [bacterium]